MLKNIFFSSCCFHLIFPHPVQTTSCLATHSPLCLRCKNNQIQASDIIHDLILSFSPTVFPLSCVSLTHFFNTKTFIFLPLSFFLLIFIRSLHTWKFSHIFIGYACLRVALDNPHKKQKQICNLNHEITQKILLKMLNDRRIREENGKVRAAPECQIQRRQFPTRSDRQGQTFH